MLICYFGDAFDSCIFCRARKTLSGSNVAPTDDRSLNHWRDVITSCPAPISQNRSPWPTPSPPQQARRWRVLRDIQSPPLLVPSVGSLCLSHCIPLRTGFRRCPAHSCCALLLQFSADVHVRWYTESLLNPKDRARSFRSPCPVTTDD